MKTIEISRESGQLNDLLLQAQNDDLLVRDPEGHEFIVCMLVISIRKSLLPAKTRN